MLLLDTTVLIDHLRGRPAAARVQALAAAGEILATTAINVEEVVRGLRAEEEVAAETLFAGLVVLPIGIDEARLAGRWRREYASRGVTLSQAECLVAASAASYGARLATGNPRDFPMSEVMVEDWPPG